MKLNISELRWNLKEDCEFFISRTETAQLLDIVEAAKRVASGGAETEFRELLEDVEVSDG